MTSLVLLAVLSTGQAAGTDSAWMNDYGAALKKTAELQKPLLIVIDLPDNEVGRVKQVSYRSSAESELMKSYVLCRVDASSKYGQAVAKAFEATSVPHTAIIDREGKSILFTKRGQFSSDDEWATMLSTYRSGVAPASVQPVSYQGASTRSQHTYQPATFQPIMAQSHASGAECST